MAAVLAPLAATVLSAMPASAATHYVVSYTAAVGTGPQGVAVDSATNTAYVANSGDGTVSIINGETHAVDTVNVGAGPISVAVDTVTGVAYVADSASTTVSLIHPDHSVTTLDLPGGVAPYAVAVDSAADRLYVTTSSNTVLVLNATTGEVIGDPINVGSVPFAIAVNSSTNTIYVANYDDSTISIINGATREVSTVGVGAAPTGVAVDESTGAVYVANSGDGTMSVVRNDAVTDTVTLGGMPYAVAVDSSAGAVYVTNIGGSDTAVVDGTTGALIQTVDVGSSPDGVGVDSSTHAAYVANYANNNVSVIVTEEVSPPVVRTTHLQPGTVGVPYTAALEAEGGTAPYTWSLASGKLPSGLALQPDGTISGTPTTAMVSTFTMRVTDHNGLTGEKQLSITVYGTDTGVVSVTPSVFRQFSSGTWTVTVKNTGGVPVLGRFTLTMSSGQRPGRVVNSEWRCSQAGMAVNCYTTSELAPGQTSSVPVTTLITASRGTMLSATAVVPSDATPEDNSRTGHAAVS